MEKSQIKKQNLTQKPSLQQRLQQKSKMIQILQQKNISLNSQIQRIALIMEQTSRQNEQKNKEDTKKQKLIQTTNDPEILNRQLKNCYKKIELYEYQVEKLKNSPLKVNTSQKLVTMQTQLKQKKSIEDRLKHELNTLVRQIAQNSKKLSGDFHQHQIEKEFKSKSDQLKFLKEMIKEYETKDTIKQKNLKVEYTHIKQIEKNFVQNGGSLQQLDGVKQRALSQFQEGRLKQVVPPKQSSEQSYYQRFNKANTKLLPNQNISFIQNVSSVNPQSEIIEDRTRTYYQSLENELNVLQKMNKKYEKQIQQSQKVLNDTQGKSELTRRRLQKMQKQIEDLNASIRLKKTCIVAQNMKPTHRKSVRSVNARQDVFNVSEVKDSTNRRKRNIISMTTVAGDNHQKLFYN